MDDDYADADDYCDNHDDNDKDDDDDHDQLHCKEKRFRVSSKGCHSYRVPIPNRTTSSTKSK